MANAMEAETDNVRDDDEEERNEIRSKLSSMSFEELQKLKVRLGTKLYKEAYYGTSRAKETNFKRISKNRPREVSSKIKPKLEVASKKAVKVRDPRFDSLSGEFNKKTFEKNYSFVNDIKKQETERLRKMLKEEKNEVESGKIKFLVQRLENQERERLKREKMEAKRNEEVREQIQQMKSGKKPHFKSKFERKMGDIVDKYRELKESGRLVKYMEKKQKKLLAKERHKRYFEMISPDDRQH